MSSGVRFIITLPPTWTAGDLACPDRQDCLSSTLHSRSKYTLVSDDDQAPDDEDREQQQQRRPVDAGRVDAPEHAPERPQKRVRHAREDVVELLQDVEQARVTPAHLA